MQNNKYKLKKNHFGFYSVSPLPNEKELAKFYEDKYFQNNKGNYFDRYTEDELLYFENTAKTAEFVYNKINTYTDSTSKKIFSIGCGEAYFEKYFYEKKWQLSMCDFSDYGINLHNPNLSVFLKKGNALDIIRNLRGQRINLINMSNVLEHVIDPYALLEETKKIMDKDSVLRIVVPNDYSIFQKMLLEMKLTEETWYTPLEHLHYFNFESLSNFLVSIGFRIKLQMSDFPIEAFLVNEHSNYAKTRSNGKMAHFARITIDNFLHSQGIENYVQYYSFSAKINYGRSVIVYVQKEIQQ